MANHGGNLLGSGAYKDNIKKERQSHKGYYELAFVEAFNSMTEKDIDIRQGYAKDLISQYLSVPEEYITFRKKSEKKTLISIDEVFYVRVGTDTVGKLSIRVQQLFKDASMTFIFQEKALRPKNHKKPTGMQGFTNKTRADKRIRDRRGRKGKKTL